jgi:predicted phage baseplate assembly protein
MSPAWWGREAAGAPPRWALVHGAGAGRRPRPLPVDRRSTADALAARVDGYTPSWTNRRPGDAGVALVQLFTELLEPVLARLDRLPEKAFVEALRVGGISTLPASPASALLEFAVAPDAAASVLVPAGFQAGAPPASGQGGLVIFETSRDLFAAPATVAELFAVDGIAVRSLPLPTGDPSSAVEPFGRRPQAGRSLYLGLAADPDASLFPRLSLGVWVASPPGDPPPASAGGVAPLPVPGAPLILWEALDGTRWVPLALSQDDSRGFARSGVVELELPRSFAPGRPRLLPGTERRRWLRARIAYGRFTAPPRLKLLRLNVAPATATRTLRDEALEPVPGTDGRRMRTAQTPVLPGSLVVAVDASPTDVAGLFTGGASAPAAAAVPADLPAAPPGTQLWHAVEDLADAGPDDRVFTLDPATGEVAFGDGVHGASVPAGFRNVRALVYRAARGADSAVREKAIGAAISSAPQVTGVTNPLPASGGMDPEDRAATLRRGPQELRARGRAVAAADYEVLALRVGGAQVARAHAVSGLHPAYPGLPVPGVVGVLVVPPDRGEGPPTPDDQALLAVATFLSQRFAPAGVEVVAAAPRYHNVRAEVGAVVEPTADVGAAVRALVGALDDYLHPLRGGEDGTGWPFGGPLRFAPLLRRLVTSVPGIQAIDSLALVVDGVRLPDCTDFATAPHALLWPLPHLVIPIAPAGRAP